MPILVAMSILLLAACGDEPVETVQPQKSQPAPTASAAPNATTVRGADGSELLTINASGHGVEISFLENGTKRTLRGEDQESGKRKYSVDGGPVLFEIKPDADSEGFKLRGPDGKLRWKVKMTPEKIKISDNEENNNPFELKMREGDRLKVVAPGERELGNVRFDRAATKTEIETASGATKFVVEGSRPSRAYGVLLLDSIPDVQRYILAAEILSRGR
jgi:hypothetical protein